MSFSLFTRSHAPTAAQMGVMKKRRDHVYRACGVVIFACIAAIALGKIFFDEFERATRFVFWFEAIAVMAFGISWLTKGEMIPKLNDRPGK